MVGWQVFDCESAERAAALLEDICRRQGLKPNQITVHSDNGGPMKGETMLATMQRLGVAHSRSRPAVSNDNPYAESLFKTLKYRPQFPLKPFADLLQARRWVPPRSVKLLDQVRERVRYLLYSLKTQKAYVDWAKAFGLCHREANGAGHTSAGAQRTVVLVSAGAERGGRREPAGGRHRHQTCWRCRSARARARPRRTAASQGFYGDYLHQRWPAE